MHLLHVVGITPTHQTFSVAFCFLPAESEEDYTWMLNNLKGIFEDLHISGPFVMVTDRELALITAIEGVFPTAHHLLCVWHVNKNVLARCKGKYLSAEDFEAFQRRWNAVVHCKSEEQFSVCWDALLQEPSAVSSDWNGLTMHLRVLIQFFLLCS